MAVPRQGGGTSSGRVNQRLRTRRAIIDAAHDLMAQGVTPTVPQAAEAALVSRTTAYRYFPTQESLLLEVAVHTDVDEIEDLVAAPPGDDETRLLAVLDLFNRHVVDAEAHYRMALRLYLDLWLRAVEAGEENPVVREGRRRRWIERTLQPLADRLDEDQRRRLTAALSVMSGIEALVALRDICHLEPEEALEVTRWAARTLVAGALDERSEP